MKNREIFINKKTFLMISIIALLIIVSFIIIFFVNSNERNAIYTPQNSVISTTSEDSNQVVHGSGIGLEDSDTSEDVIIQNESSYSSVSNSSKFESAKSEKRDSSSSDSAVSFESASTTNPTLSEWSSGISD